VLLSEPGGGEDRGPGGPLREDQAGAEGPRQQGAVHGLVQRQAPAGQLVTGRPTRTHTHTHTHTHMYIMQYIMLSITMLYGLYLCCYVMQMFISSLGWKSDCLGCIYSQ